MKSAIPTAPEFVREAVIIIGGAILAALILSRVPALRAWITDNTRGERCDCENP
jgi:hypothetical protein